MSHVAFAHSARLVLPRRLLLKAAHHHEGMYSKSAGYYLLAGRWHKLKTGEKAPKGAPVAAHPQAAGQHLPAAHFTDDQWAALKLPDSNVNAPSYNKALDKLKEWSDAGNVTAIVGAGYGLNTYGQKLAKIANHLLGLHGSAHEVVAGQKSGEHAAVQSGPAEPHPSGLPEHLAPKTTTGLQEPGGMSPLAQHVKDSLDQKAADGDVEFIKLVAANNPEHPQIVAYAKQKLAELGAASTTAAAPALPDLDSPEDMAANHEAAPALAMPAFEEGKTTTGVKAYYEKVAQKVIDHGLAGNVAVLEGMKDVNGKSWQGKTANSKKLLALHKQALAYAKGGAKPAAPKQTASEIVASGAGNAQLKEWLRGNPGKEGDLVAALQAAMKNHVVVQLGLDGVDPTPNGDEGPKEGDTKPAADGGTLVLKDGHWVKQGGDEPAAVKPEHFEVSPGDVFKLDSQYQKMNAGEWVVYNISADGAQVYMHKVGAKVPNATNSATIPATTLAEAVAKGTAKKQTAPPAPASAPATGPLSPQQLQNLQSIPWFKLKLPAENTNAKSHNAALAKIEAMAFAGDTAGLQAFIDAKAGAKQTYAKKQVLTAQTALAGLQVQGATAAVPVEPAPSLAGKPAYDHIAHSKKGSMLKQSAVDAWMAANPGAWGEMNEALTAHGHAAMADLGPEEAKPAPAAAIATELTPAQIEGLKGWFAAGKPTSKHPGSWSNLWKKLSPGMKAAVKAELEAEDPPAEAGPPPSAPLLAGVSAATAIASFKAASPNASLADLEAKWKEANAGKVGLNAEWSMAANPAPASLTIDPEQKQILDDLAAGEHWVDIEDLAQMHGPGTPLHAYAQKLLARKPTPEQLDAAAAPAPAASPPAAPAAPVVVQSMVFHNTMDDHSKFWSVSTNGSTLMTQYGKIGANAQKTIKQFASPAAALAESKKLMQQKHAKGYSYQGAGKHSYDAAPAAEQGPKEGDTKQGADGLLVLKNGHWVKVGGDHAAPAMDAWTKIGEQGGSNPGGKFRDPSGQEWYCKWPSDPEAIASEVLAAKLYALAGLSSQDCMVVTKGGKPAIATKWVNIKKAGTAAALAKIPGALDGFAVDAWLGNWDVVGMSLDNLQIGPDGKAHRVDAGGSLEYRAQGAKKPFGAKVDEIDTLRSAKLNPHAAAVFGKMTEADITASVAKVLAIDDAAIRAMVAEHGPGDEAARKALADTLIARKADLFKRYPKAAKPGAKKPLDRSALPIDPKTIPKPHDFENWNGPGKGLSSKAAINQANAADEYAMLALAQAGNLTALKTFQFTQVNKDTGTPTGAKLPISQHPSKHVVQYHSDLVQLLDEVANPPEPLKVFRTTDVGTVAGLSAAFPPKPFGTTVSKVSSNEKLGFWVALGAITGVAKFAPKVTHDYSTAAIHAAKEKYKTASALAKHFISSVQASGTYNDLFRDGKTTDSAGNKLTDVAKAALAHATEMPEGTSLYRWQKMSPQMLAHIMSAKEGTVFQATGPMCTSYHPTATKNFGTHRVKIRYAKGAKAVESFASGGFASEKEVTTLPNARFVILSKQMVPDVEHGNPGAQRLELEILMLPPDLGIKA